MAAPDSLSCFAALDEDAQFYWIYVALGGVDLDLSCFSAMTRDGQLWNIYNIISMVFGDIQVVNPPTGGDPAWFTDFSMFPGGILPVTGVYFALDDNWIWTLRAAIDTTWQQTPRSN